MVKRSLRKVVHLPRSNTYVKMRGAVRLLSLCTFVARRGTTLPFLSLSVQCLSLVCVHFDKKVFKISQNVDTVTIRLRVRISFHDV